MSPTDALPKLPPTIARHTVFLLMELLPPPLTDTPEERAARDEAAIASLAVLNPGDAYEAALPPAPSPPMPAPPNACGLPRCRSCIPTGWTSASARPTR